MLLASAFLLTLCAVSAAPMIPDADNGNVDGGLITPGGQGGDLFGIGDGASADNHTQEEWLMLIGALVVATLVIVAAYMSIDHEDNDGSD